MNNALTKEGKKLFPLLKKFSGFYLAGGTGLALQIKHRISIDFDLFSRNKIPRNLLQEVEKIFSGQKIKISVNNSDELTIFIDEIKITFLHYPFAVYSQYVEIEGVKAISPREIAFTKAYSIGRRGSYKDYVDLYFLLKGGYISLGEIIKNNQKIFGDGFSDRLFLEQLVYMKDVDEIDIKFLKTKVSKKDLEIYFASEVKKFGKTI
jgi:hypothetical protein